LQTHIKTAKYCLKIRGEKLDTNYVCNHCDAQFTQKIALRTHLKSCKIANNSTYMEDIKSLNEKIIALEDILKDNQKIISELRTKSKQEKDKNIKLTEKNKVIVDELKQSELSNQQLLKELETKTTKISEQKVKIKNRDVTIMKLQNENATCKGILIGVNSAKPQVVHNNNNNKHNNKNVMNTTVNQKLSLIPIDNIRPLTIDLVNQNINKYDYNSFQKGILGIVNFIKELTILELDDGTIEKNYASTSSSRDNFHRLIENKEWKQDAGARHLQLILTALAEPASKYMEMLTKELAEADIRSNKKLVLLKMQNDLSPLVCGLKNENSKERENIFVQIKSKVRNTNGC